MNGSPSLHLWWIPLLPFAGFLLNGLLGQKLPRILVSTVALLTTAASFALVLNIALHFSQLTLPHVETLSVPWIQAGTFHADFSFALDQLTLVMLLVVTGVGFLIHIYSVGYMAHEEGYWRFFAYLNLFMFFMLILVLAENFLLMFVGWEGVGLASYLLIGFYFERNSAAKAGMKAFVVNRIGDFGFLLAMFLLIAHFGTLSFGVIFSQVAQHTEWQGGFLTAIAIFLVLGATGKSAQIPLYVWLPDAMEGPTPVSALIHAATMVTAGIYMVARTHVIFDRSPLALSVVAIIGAATAFFAATIAIVQTDIKRALAYSTVSQLGYMFLACGVAAYSSGIFHLFTHAFFKALLFLGAGSVIHALSGEQDMREMGGLRRRIPWTCWTMFAGVVAISGIFPFAGFFSKDEILAQVFASPHGGPVLWAVGWVTALLTSFYMFRLWYLTFSGQRRAKATGAHSSEAGHPPEPMGHAPGVHESPWVMLVPLVILALLSLAGGWVGWPESLHGNNSFQHFLDPVLSTQAPPWQETALISQPTATSKPQTMYVNNQGSAAARPEIPASTERLLSGLSLAAGLLGWFLADLFYRRRPALPARLAAQSNALYRVLVNKYWVDELYAAFITRPMLFFSRYGLWRAVDNGVVDGVGYAAAGSAIGLGALVRRIQSGNLRSYAGWLAFGAACLLVVLYFGLGPHAAPHF